MMFEEGNIVYLRDYDYNIVYTNMSKYFTVHYTAGSLIKEMPDSSKFLADLKILEDYIKSIKKRR